MQPEFTAPSPYQVRAPRPHLSSAALRAPTHPAAPWGSPAVDAFQRAALREGACVCLCEARGGRARVRGAGLALTKEQFYALP